MSELAPVLRVVGAVFTEPAALSVAQLAAHPPESLRVLAFRRGPGRDAAGLWEFAGGKIEGAETPEDALVRELDEELGVHARVGDLLHASEVTVHVPGRDDRRVHLSCYLVTAEQMPVSSTDHDELRWMLASELPSLHWIAPDVPVVEALLAAL